MPRIYITTILKSRNRFLDKIHLLRLLEIIVSVDIERLRFRVLYECVVEVDVNLSG
jgi:hypothetical protein